MGIPTLSRLLRMHYSERIRGTTHVNSSKPFVPILFYVFIDLIPFIDLDEHGHYIHKVNTQWTK